MYHEDVAKILFKLINKRGIINIGGKAEFVYNFAKKNNPKVKKIFLKKDNKIGMPFDSSLNIKKLYKMIKKNSNN
jgi:dTDP-4-dehydrorhamnose reductase